MSHRSGSVSLAALFCCTTLLAGGSLKVLKTTINATGGTATMPANFAMKVTCTPSGPTNQSITVPAGTVGNTLNGITAASQCTVTEPPIAHIAHLDACKGGGATWTTMYSAQPVTIIANGTVSVTVRNTLKCDPPSTVVCQKFTPSVTACGVAIALNRTVKGPNAYTVTVAPTAVTPSANSAPSSSSSCVSASNATVLLTNCAYYFSSAPTSVTLTASSSSGSLPTGFLWSGACSGSGATCVVSITQTPMTVGANFP